MENVKCSVSDCRHWASGEQCTASAIEISVDGGGKVAGSSVATRCHTYEKK
ncbi:MAG: DUF1540 domain-containing protein [Firmicutes bacterium]|nr:DUF1540 domain-containing protein [Bacillota bacterium]